MDDTLSLPWLLGDYPSGRFFKEKFEQTFHYVEAQSRLCEQPVFSLQQFWALIDNGAALYPQVRLHKAGKEVEPTRYCRTIRAARQNLQLIDPSALKKEIACGATALFVGLGSLSPVLGRIVRNLTNQTPFYFTANGYFTPQGTDGSPTHYDAHDVFILQIEGKKNWKLHEKIYDLPIEDQLNTFEEIISKPVIAEVTMSPGDVLYVPRGMPHTVRSHDDHPSLHITFGLYPVTGWDMLQEIIGHDIGAHLRRSIVFPPDGKSRIPLAEQLAEDLEALACALRKQPAVGANFYDLCQFNTIKNLPNYPVTPESVSLPTDVNDRTEVFFTYPDFFRLSANTECARFFWRDMVLEHSQILRPFLSDLTIKGSVVLSRYLTEETSSDLLNLLEEMAQHGLVSFGIATCSEAYTTLPPHAARDLEVIQECANWAEEWGIELVLTGGWAVDIHAGKVSRSHSDLDWLVHEQDMSKMHRLLRQRGVIDIGGSRQGQRSYIWRGVKFSLFEVVKIADIGGFAPIASVNPNIRWLDGEFITNPVKGFGFPVKLSPIKSLLASLVEKWFYFPREAPILDHHKSDIQVLEGLLKNMM